MARFPTTNGVVAMHDASGAVLRSAPGEAIMSPEAGWVLYAYKRPPHSPVARLGPWIDKDGEMRHAEADARDIHGPAIIVVAGASGVFHVLSELGGLNNAIVQPNGAGWYTNDVLQPTAQRMSTPLAPTARLDMTPMNVPNRKTLMATVAVPEGQVLGFARAEGNTHWRVRSDVYSAQSQQDPIAWLQQHRAGQGQAAPADDDAGAMLALIALLLWGL